VSIASALNIARTGLNVSGQRAETVAANVANATTPGYVRRSLSVSETIHDGQSSGLRVVATERAQDGVIKSQRRAVTSDAAQATFLSQSWKALSVRLGSTADGTGLFKSFSDLDTALTRAATAPESAINLNQVLVTAKSVIQELGGLSNFTRSMRAEADREIAAGVGNVNAALKEIETLNRRLAGMDRSSAQAAALFDERQRALDIIAEYLPVKTVERDAGAIDVYTPEGVFLLTSTAREIEFQPGNDFSPGSSLAGGTLSGVSVDGTPLTPGSASFGAISSGLLSALFTLRDTDLPAFNAQLDLVASDLMARFSGATDPTLLPGEAGLFFDPDPGAGPGLAARLRINPAVDPESGGQLWRLRNGMNAATEGPPGNGTLLTAMQTAFRSGQQLNSSGFQGVFSAIELVAQFTSQTGETRLYHEGVAASANTQHVTLMEAEQRITGVDVDAELQQLLLIEQAFAANARVIQVAGDMIRILMEI
jgi:flagellar hook-associated protein 1 FlgK